MTISTHIVDPLSSTPAGVGSDGRLHVGPPQYSIAFNAELAVDATPVNIVPAKADCIFVITDIILTGNKNISATVDSVTNIYEGSAADTSFANRSNELLTIPVGKSSQIPLNGVFLKSNTATWINGVASDDDVFVTILGYYIKVAE